MKEMFVHYNIPFTGFMAENMWVTDFGLGDFENVGMGGMTNVPPRALLNATNSQPMS